MHWRWILKKENVEIRVTWNEKQSEKETYNSNQHVELECFENVQTYDTVSTLILRIDHHFYSFFYHVNYSDY